MNETREMVKRWNSVKGTRYPFTCNGEDSAIVKTINKLEIQYGEEKIGRYFEAMLANENLFNIWTAFSYREIDKWLNENPVEKPIEEPKGETKGMDILGALSQQIVSLIGEQMAKEVANKVRSEMDEYIKDKTIVKVVEYNGKKQEIDDITHEKFEDVLKFVAMNEPVFLTGPAGCGKNVLAEQIAKALGLDFYFTNAVTQEYKLTGYGDAMGNFKETQFYQWCKNGGLFMFDEMDGSIAEAMLVVNSALANGYFDFPIVGRVKLNENCRVIACGNTWGTGASMEYVGRNQLDGATLNRFASVFVDYDARIEEHLAGGNKDVLDFCREFRKLAERNGCHCIVSYREIKRLHKMIDIAKMNITDAIRYCVVKGLEKDSLRMIANAMSDTIAYRKNLMEIVNN